MNPLVFQKKISKNLCSGASIRTIYFCRVQLYGITTNIFLISQ